MDIDIDARRFDLNVNEIRRRIAIRQELIIAIDHRLLQVRTPKITTVDEKELFGAVFLGRRRKTHIPADLHDRRIDLHLQQLIARLAPHDRRNALLHPPRRQAEEGLVIGHQRESQLRMAKRHPLKLRDDLFGFRRIRLQKLPTRRGVEKQVAHRHLRPPRTADPFGPRIGLRPPGNRHQSPHLIHLPARTELDLGHRRDRGQCLAPKTERLQGKEVFRLSDFRRGVSREADHGISPAMPHPSSITCTRLFPPSRTTTLTDRAPASTAFSINSLTIDAGRCTTSPAAIWLATWSGNIFIRSATEFSLLC